MRISDWSSDVCSSVLHQRWGGEDAGLLSYDADRLLAEVALLVDWYLPAVTGRDTLPAQRASYLAAWRDVLPAMLSVPHKPVLRHLHVANLLGVAGTSGIARSALPDYHDAATGPTSSTLVTPPPADSRSVPRRVGTELPTP